MALLQPDRGLELCLDSVNTFLKGKRSEEKLNPNVGYINNLILIQILQEELVRLLAANVKNFCEGRAPMWLGESLLGA